MYFTQWNGQNLAEWFDEFWQMPTACICLDIRYFCTLESTLISLQSKPPCTASPIYVYSSIPVLPVLKLLMNRIMQLIYICIWLLLFSMYLIIVCMSRLFSLIDEFYDSIIMPQFTDPFFCWWTFWLILFLN